MYMLPLRVGDPHHQHTPTLPLTHEQVGHLRHAASGAAPAPKLVLYSAHDWTVMPLLMILSDASASAPWPRFCRLIVVYYLCVVHGL